MSFASALWVYSTIPSVAPSGIKQNRSATSHFDSLMRRRISRSLSPTQNQTQLRDDDFVVEIVRKGKKF